ncbi:MAG: TrmH family RNA methyltransferase [Bacilli bacterium]|nr:TrmH family RNA methyltransferase [Bacilli bacterium]
MKKYKKTDLESYTLGTTLTLELLNKKIEYVKRVYIHSKQEKNETYNKIVSICNNNKIEIIYSDKVINTLSDKENCYIIGVFEKFSCNIDYNNNHIVLINPSNMGNLGTIIRSSVGFNIKDLVIISPGVDIFDPKVIRSSMGAIFNIRFKYFDSFNDYIKLCNKRREYYPFMLKAKTNLKDVKVNNQFSLIFGNEATGLSDEYLHVGIPLIIKHTKNIDSLNLDNAVSIALYEFSKNDF